MGVAAAVAVTRVARTAAEMGAAVAEPQPTLRRPIGIIQRTRVSRRERLGRLGQLVKMKNPDLQLNETAVPVVTAATAAVAEVAAVVAAKRENLVLGCWNTGGLAEMTKRGG